MPIEQSDIPYTPITDEVQAYSDIGVREMIGRSPGWLLNSGVTMVAIVFATILVMSYFIQYPDKLTSSGILTSTTPPIEVVAKTSGSIDRMVMKDGDDVDKGESLLYIHSTLDRGDLSLLKEWLMSYREEDRKYKLNSFPDGLTLGNIQPDYAMLQLRYSEYLQVMNNNIVEQKKQNIRSEIEKINLLNRSLEREKDLYSRELALGSKDLNRQEVLHQDEVISDLEMENAQSSYLQKERQYEGMNNAITQNLIRIEQLKLELINIQDERDKTLQGYRFTIDEIISRLEANINNWSESYEVISNEAGQISYLPHIQEKRTINQGDIIGYIIPSENPDRYVSSLYPTQNIGKVEKGQKVIVKLDPYPYKEYGTITSQVSSISRVPVSEGQNGTTYYEIQIPLEERLITDYQDTIPYSPNMTATTEIITEDLSILERIFDQFLSLIKQ